MVKLKNLSDKRLKALEQNGIHSELDLIYHLPFRYSDYTQIISVPELKADGQIYGIFAKCKSLELIGHGKQQRLDVYFTDNFAQIKAVWFKGASFFKKKFTVGHTYVLFGAVKQYGRIMSLAHPQVFSLDEYQVKKDKLNLLPHYPSSATLTAARISDSLFQQWALDLLQKDIFIKDGLPTSLKEKYKLVDLKTALSLIHNPLNHSHIKHAKRRLKFDELFLFQLSVICSKKLNHKKDAVVFDSNPSLTQKFITQLPFELTIDQKKAIETIANELKSGVQQNRLIQGDVGSGKTVVAIAAMLMAVDNGFQAVIMAPTEILAEQHAQNILKFCSDLPINVRLLTGSQGSAQRREILEDIANGSCHIICGTHALFQDKVNYRKLGLVVIDEQHRFGVMQRAKLLEKGQNPHTLLLSATPIPRSLGLTLYGELDVTKIKSKPSGRKSVITAIRTDHQRDDVYGFCRTVLLEGGQIYVVYPLVEESEKIDLKNATDAYEQLSSMFPEVNVGLLHGKMPADEKEAVMKAFKNAEYNILVSTTVIEVGVDVPNASVMIIEHAERFGLSQLHQLRGRVGRGERQSYCILMASSALGKEGKERLKTLERSEDGFEIAEVDLKMRGPGDFLGTRQSGLPEFKLADIVEDANIVEVAREEAEILLEDDPQLKKPEHQALKSVFEPYFEKRKSLYTIG